MPGRFTYLLQKAELPTDITYVSAGARNPLWARGGVREGCVSAQPGRGRAQLPDSPENPGVPDEGQDGSVGRAQEACLPCVGAASVPPLPVPLYSSPAWPVGHSPCPDPAATQDPRRAA